MGTSLARTEAMMTRRHAASFVLLAIGLVIATRLALDQLGLLGGAFEPLFGDGTERVLHSSVSRALPVPDALVGAFAYAFELSLLSLVAFGGSHERPWKPIAYGSVAALMALTAAGLIVMQAFVIHAWCTLCLASALVSFGVFALAAPDLLRAWHDASARHSLT